MWKANYQEQRRKARETVEAARASQRHVDRDLMPRGKNLKLIKYNTVLPLYSREGNCVRKCSEEG